MRILMLGWEYPPHISGGLGTACQGLTEALARLGLDIQFVVPKLYGDENVPHMQIAEAAAPPSTPPGDVTLKPSAEDLPPPPAEHAVAGQPSTVGVVETVEVVEQRLTTRSVPVPGHTVDRVTTELVEEEAPPRLRTVSIESWLLPYLTPEQYEEAGERRVLRVERRARESVPGQDSVLVADQQAVVTSRVLAALPEAVSEVLEAPMERAAAQPEHYGTDLFAEVGRYANRALQRFAGEDFDLIHAHDWLTYPAGLALAEASGKPLVVHVHSLEYDRSGRNVDHRINTIERAGVNRADAVIAVSHYTRTMTHREHGVPIDRIAVVHNGVYPREVVESYRTPEIPRGKVVLFLGRITFQKGPDYFVEAAARVIPHVPNVTFVMAGSGDMLPRMIERVAELGITRNFRFTGFLRGKDVERMFSMADLYVMPSVSEPFGISSLEALSYDTPVILSRQSGVAEVLSHAMKVDFWDVEQLANLIIGVLKYPQLRDDIVGMAREEVKRLHWDAAAEKTLKVYQRVLGRGSNEGAITVRQGVN